MTIAIICIIYFGVIALRNHCKATEKKKAEQMARHLEQMREIQEAVKQLEKSKRALANRKSATETHWF
jgi:hypothetical protein